MFRPPPSKIVRLDKEKGRQLNCACLALSPSRAPPFGQDVGGVGGDSFRGFSGRGGGKTKAGDGGGRGGEGHDLGGRNGLRGWDLEPPDSVLGGFSALTGGEGGYHTGVLKHARSAGSLATAADGAGEAIKQGLPRRASGIRQQAAAAAAAAAEAGDSSSGGERHKQNQRT